MSEITRRIFLSNEAFLEYPEVSIDHDLLNFPNAVLSAITASQTLIVSGNRMVSPLVVTAPAEWIINTDNSNTNMSPITLNHTAGTIAATNIYVKFAPVTDSLHNNDITFTATNLNTKKVNVIGTIAP